MTRPTGPGHIEEKVDYDIDELRAQIHRFFRWGIIILAIVGVTTAASIFGFGVLLKKQGEQQDQIAQQAQQIQLQRQESIRMTCEDTNDRHDNTVEELNRLIDKAIKEAKTPEEKAQFEAARASNVKLIDLLSPKQNCAAIVEKAVQPVGKEP